MKTKDITARLNKLSEETSLPKFVVITEENEHDLLDLLGIYAADTNVIGLLFEIAEGEDFPETKPYTMFSPESEVLEYVHGHMDTPTLSEYLSAYYDIEYDSDSQI